MGLRPMMGVLAVVAIAVVLLAIVEAVFVSTLHRRVGEKTREAMDVTECYAAGDDPDPGPERVRCIDDNVDALVWRLRLIESAQDELVLSTFDFREDDAGTDIIAAFQAAAERGVSVRIIVDDLNGSRQLTKSAAFNALAAHPNVEVRLYNELHLLRPWKYTFRLHDKYLVADEVAYVFGGRNVSNLFLGNYGGKRNIDRDLLVYEASTDDGACGSLSQVRAYFEAIWRLPETVEFEGAAKSEEVASAVDALHAHYAALHDAYPGAFESTDLAAATMPTSKITLLSNPQEPSTREPTLWYTLQQLMSDAREVIIQTPYIVCSRDMYRGLTDVCDNTEQVELITNAVESGANPFGCTDYLGQKRKIHKTGATVYEYLGSSSSHKKTILVDGRLSIVGSYNLDMRSTYLDTEMMLAVDCPQLNEELRACAEADKDRSKRVDPDGSVTFGDKYRPVVLSWGRRLRTALLRVVIRPIRSLL